MAPRKRKPANGGVSDRDAKKFKLSPPSPTSSHSSASSSASSDSGLDKDAEKKRLHNYLTIRAQDLGIGVEPAKGLDPDYEAEGESDSEDDSDGEEVEMGPVEDPINSLRERCDNALDTVEEALRTVDRISNRTLHPDIIFPKKANRKTRNQRRRKHKTTYKLDSEIEPIRQMRKGKAKKKMAVTMSALALRNLARELSQRLVDELSKRGVQHPHDVARFRYLSKRAKRAEAAEAKRVKPQELSQKLVDELLKRGIKYPHDVASFKNLSKAVKKAEKEVKPPERTLEQQWDKHGLGLRELLDLYNGQGARCVDPIREELETKCRQYGLSTHREVWDLDRSILLYELASKRRLYGLPQATQAVLDGIISSLRDIEARKPEEADAVDAANVADAAGDDSDDAGGPFKDLDGAKGKGKGKGTGTGGKDTEEEGCTGKAAKGKATATESTRVTRGGKAKGKKQSHLVKEIEMSERKQLTISAGNRTQTFGQFNVSGAGNRCFWHAVQRLWIGRQREASGTLLERYPVNARVQELWNAVMHPAPKVTNPARQTRLELYGSIQNDSLQNSHGSLEERVRNLQWGDEDMAQLVADALEIEVFMYRPIWGDDGVSDWYRIVRGEPQNDPARQIHLANYSEALHWTALTPVGSFVLPPLGINNRRPTFTQPPNTPPLNRLAAGAQGNIDLRPAARRTSPEDGHVPDLTEEMELEEDDDDEDEDGKDGKDDQQDGDNADGMNLDGKSDSDKAMSDAAEDDDTMDIEKSASDEEMQDAVAAYYASRSRSTSKSPSASKSRPASKDKPIFTIP